MFNILFQKLDFIESDSSCSSEALSKKELSAEELYHRLEKLIIEDKANDEQIFDWVEVQRLCHPLCFSARKIIVGPLNSHSNLLT
jgi:hypothetical protein